MTRLMHSAKRPDDGFDKVLAIRVHKSKPFPQAAYRDESACTDDAPAKDGDCSARPFDIHGLRRSCPIQWGKLCRIHFRNADDVARFFNTDEKTGRNWFEGKHAPSAAFVIHAVASFPDALAVLLGAE